MKRAAFVFAAATPLLLLLLAMLAGCGAGAPADDVPAPPPTPPLLGQAPIPALGRVPVTNAAPAARLVRADALPPPFATPSASNGARVIARPGGAGLSVPPGFFVYEWATDLSNPRIVTVAPSGDVFVAETAAGRVSVLRDKDRDGRPEINQVFASGLRQPFGIAFYPPGPAPTHVYVANTDSVVRFPYQSGDLAPAGAAETIVANLPTGGHSTRNLVFGPGGAKLYVSVGSHSNVGEEEARRAAILEFSPDGSNERVFASGLRNPVGLDFEPATGALWTTVNERDGLGDDLVPDFVTRVRSGAFYGWPYFYLGANDEPRMPDRPDLAGVVAVPDVLIGAHSAPLGLVFYTGAAFPAAYQNAALVALHGSWNRAERDGYRVVRLLPGGGYEDFVWGWKTGDGEVWGRPVDLAVMNDGSLLITDDGAGTIWRVTYGLAADL